MRRVVARQLVMLCSALSLLLAIAAVALWVRSYRWSYTLTRTAGEDYWHGVSANGRLILDRETNYLFATRSGLVSTPPAQPSFDPAVTLVDNLANPLLSDVVRSKLPGG